jgi:hypothetical protein
MGGSVTRNPDPPALQFCIRMQSKAEAFMQARINREDQILPGLVIQAAYPRTEMNRRAAATREADRLRYAMGSRMFFVPVFVMGCPPFCPGYAGAGSAVHTGGAGLD